MSYKISFLKKQQILVTKLDMGMDSFLKPFKEILRFNMAEICLGSQAVFYIYPTKIFLFAYSHTKYDRTKELANYIASLFINKPIEIFSEKSISRELLKEYIGTYKMTGEILRALKIKVYKGAIILNDPKYPENDAILTASEKDIFLLKVASASFQFFRNDEGKVSGYTVKQGKDTFTFKKVK